MVPGGGSDQGQITAYHSTLARILRQQDKPSNRQSNTQHDTPMTTVELKPQENAATLPEINRYQRKIGSLLFAAVTTRPDMAFTTSRLARFLTNPGQHHQDAAGRVLLYLQSTGNQALELGGDDCLEVASDASFADNTPNRKSKAILSSSTADSTPGEPANKKQPPHQEQRPNYLPSRRWQRRQCPYPGCSQS